MAAAKAHRRETTSGGTSSLPRLRAKEGRKADAQGRAVLAPSSGFPFKAVAIVLAVFVVLAIAFAIALVVLSHTSAFTISSIDAEDSEHVSAADVAALAGVPEGTTLLNYDEGLILENLRRNPWIADAKLTREFPDKLKVSVTERQVGALVVMNSGSVIWCLGTDDVWIEPVKISAAEGQSIAEAALASTVGTEKMLVTGVPLTVNPVAGTRAEDDVFEALRTFRAELSEGFYAQIVSFDAPSVEGISCVLKSGVKVSLGAPTNIASKETVVSQLMAKYPNRLTYINVRVPSNPSYRMLESEAVESGSGAAGDLDSTQG